MKVLVSGGGIAGLTVSLRLLSGGHDLLVVEKAPSLRDEGYMLDFYGPGYDAGERMGLLPGLAGIHHPIGRLAFLGSGGREVFSIDYAAYRRLFGGRHFYLMRGDLERLLYSRAEGRIPIRFAATVESLEEEEERVRITFSDGTVGFFDLVVGADGAHSRIRNLVFGEEERFRRSLGYVAAAFLVEAPPESPVPGDAFSFLAVRGRQVGVYPIRGGRLAALFIHKSGRSLGGIAPEAAVRDLRSVYGGAGWIVPELLDRCDPSALYIGDVSQIAMPSWSRGRVVLVGDACQSLSPLTAQGASLAVAGAFVLAEEMERAGNDVRAALARYERRVKPAASRVQAAGRRLASWFVPESSARLKVRNVALRAAVWPVAPWIFRRLLAVGRVIE
jgi:2-polyprenyl-6-methoxyphenol hydroxylase-like FAD-dependent oxidoreductase